MSTRIDRDETRPNTGFRWIWFILDFLLDGIATLIGVQRWVPIVIYFSMILDGKYLMDFDKFITV